MFKFIFCFTVLFLSSFHLFGDGSDSYLFNRGLTCWKTGRYDTAIRYFQNYQKRNSSNHEESAKAFLWIGKCQYYKWNVDEAITAFKTVLTVYPSSGIAPSAHKWIGDCHFHSRRYTLAITAYQQYIIAFPSDEAVPLALYFLGKAYQKTGELDKAISVLQRVMNQYPSHYIANQCRLLLHAINKKVMSYRGCPCAASSECLFVFAV